jgi:hypothetical protein
MSASLAVNARTSLKFDMLAYAPGTMGGESGTEMLLTQVSQRCLELDH